MTQSNPRLRVSIVSGVVVARDAVSNIVRQHMETITTWAVRREISTELKVFVLGSDVNDSRIWTCQDPAGLVRDEHFLQSDLILYHFGIYYNLFDTIHLTPRSARVVVYHHGVTPPNWFPAEQRELIYRSFEQTVNFHCADRVLTTSSHLNKDLLAMGVEPTRLFRCPIWVPAAENVPTEPRTWSRDDLNLVYLGRFAQAKGLAELIDAVDQVRRRVPFRVRLRMVGSQRFSPPGYVDSLRQQVEARGLNQAITFHFDVTSEELNRHLGESDTLVLPSHHEGFCVPVLEAMANGAFVICSDAGALPETSGGLGLIHPVGDAEALAERIIRFADGWRRGHVESERGVFTQPEWHTQLREHLSQFSRASAEAEFERRLFEDMTPVPESDRVGLRKRQEEMLKALANVSPPGPTSLMPSEEDVPRLIQGGFRSRTGYDKFAA